MILHVNPVSVVEIIKEAYSHTLKYIIDMKFFSLH